MKFQINRVKDKNAELGNEPINYTETVRTIVEGGVVLIAAYMGADTLRKILVHVVTAKIR